MEIYVDHWGTCYHESGFFLKMDSIPRVGDELIIHKSLMGDRFFNEEPFIKSPLNLIDDCVICTVAVVQHTVVPNSHTVEICIVFDGDDPDKD